MSTQQQSTPREGAPDGESRPAARTLLDAVRDAVDSAGAATVFGEPISHGDATVIPAARVFGRGGGGGGGGAAASGDHGGGSGAGIALSAKPVGAYVIYGGRVRWRPAVDVTGVLLGAQAVAIIALIAGRLMRRRMPPLIDRAGRRMEPKAGGRAGGAVAGMAAGKVVRRAVGNIGGMPGFRAGGMMAGTAGRGAAKVFRPSARKRMHRMARLYRMPHLHRKD